MKPEEIKPGETVELADKETSFFDPATELKVVRDQTAKLGKTIGNKTNTAIMSGRLLIVGGGKTKAAQASKGETKSDLPDDLPGRDVFAAAGMDLEQVRNFDFEKEKVAGIGPATIKSIGEYFSK